MFQITYLPFQVKSSATFHALSPDGYPLRMHGRRVGLEVTKLLLLLGIATPHHQLFLAPHGSCGPVGHTDGLTTVAIIDAWIRPRCGSQPHRAGTRRQGAALWKASGKQVGSVATKGS